jgi:hypothetical protein
MNNYKCKKCGKEVEIKTDYIPIKKTKEFFNRLYKQKLCNKCYGND